MQFTTQHDISAITEPQPCYLPLQANSSITGITFLHLLSSCEEKIIRYYEQPDTKHEAWIDNMKMPT